MFLEFLRVLRILIYIRFCFVFSFLFIIYHCKDLLASFLEFLEVVVLALAFLAFTFR